MSQIDLNPERKPLPKPEKSGPKTPKWIKVKADHQWTKTRKAYLAGKQLHNGRYICERCGAQTEQPEVHHVLTRGSRPDLKYDLTNLVAICKPCHQQAHGQ